MVDSRANSNIDILGSGGRKLGMEERTLRDMGQSVIWIEAQ